MQPPRPPPARRGSHAAGCGSRCAARSLVGCSSSRNSSRSWRRQPPARALLAAALLLALAACGHAAPLINSRPGNVLAMILTDCKKYQDWQTIAAAFAWRHSEQPGAMIRVANCEEQEKVNYDKRMLDYVATHLAKQYAYYAPLKDYYHAYNKPGAVVDYFEHFNPPQEWVIVLDSDMLLRVPFEPEKLQLKRGWAFGGHYGYLVGTNNDLAMRHVPDIAPRNDTLAGPVGRRGDRVGGPYFMHRDDLRKLAPQWLNWTHIMRDDMEAYKDSGDTASKKGDRIWIAEMYGYAFGAAKTDVWHIWAEDFMLYPSYMPSMVPHVLHYGLIYHVDDWTYDKHWYFDFDSHACTPWDLTKEKPKHGIFPPPPHPSKLKAKEGDNRYKDLVAVSAVTIINAALCDYHIRNCPPSAQLTEVCDQVFEQHFAVDQEIRDIEWNWDCRNHNGDCEAWAARGECEKMAAYMSDHCKLACKQCTPRGPRPIKPSDALLTVADISKEIGVVPVPAGGSGDVAAAEAARKEAEQRLAAAEAAVAKAAADKAAAEAKAAAAEAAAAAAAAEAAKTTKAAQQDEAELRAKYPASSLGYAVLVRRCTDLVGLTNSQIQDCVRAASFRLAYPGAVKTPTAPAPEPGADRGGDNTKPSDAGATAAGGGTEQLQDADTPAAPGDAAQQEHALGGGGDSASRAWVLVGQGAAVAALVGVLYYAYAALQAYRVARAKQKVLRID